MSYPALNAYLERLATGETPSSSLRLSGDGEVQGHIFNCWLGSAFSAYPRTWQRQSHGLCRPGARRDGRRPQPARLDLP